VSVLELRRASVKKQRVEDVELDNLSHQIAGPAEEKHGSFSLGS
jgi:hypothetical protein